MVVFVDLEDEVEPPELPSFGRSSWPPQHGLPIMTSSGASRTAPSGAQDAQASEEEANMKISYLMEAMGCYPVVCEIASHLDLNTLDNLSRTCRQVRRNLLQFRSQLMARTLRCAYDDVVPDYEARYRARAPDLYFQDMAKAPKVGACARDMVSDCRRCGTIICRNCTIKPPAPILLRKRHRRLCPKCIRAPLAALITSTGCCGVELAPLQADTVKRVICTCATEGVWLCQTCGRGLSGDDQAYEGIWRWRVMYGDKLGGLGTGIGEGDRSFKCGRGGKCLAGKQVQAEIDCDAEDARESEEMRGHDGGYSSSAGSNTSDTWETYLSGSPGYVSGRGTPQRSPGYNRQEVEGIGGVVKKKLVRMVRVGACVAEWDDEKEHGQYMKREQEGKVRSWCGWCWRVIPGPGDNVA